MGVLPKLFKLWPWVDLDPFYAKVKFGHIGFCKGKSENYLFFGTYCSFRSQSCLKQSAKWVYEVERVWKVKVILWSWSKVTQILKLNVWLLACILRWAIQGLRALLFAVPWVAVVGRLHCICYNKSSTLELNSSSAFSPHQVKPELQIKWIFEDNLKIIIPPKVRGVGIFQCRSRASASAWAWGVVSIIFLESVGGILPNLHGYIIWTVKGWLSFGNFDPIFKVTGGFRLLNLLCWGDNFLYAWYLLNQWKEFHQTFTDISLRQT